MRLTLSLPKKVAAEVTAAEVTVAEGTAEEATPEEVTAAEATAAFMSVTEVADTAAHTVATSVRLTGSAAAFQCRCQLLVAGKPAARSR